MEFDELIKILSSYGMKLSPTGGTMAENSIHMPGAEVQATDLGKTEKWFFPAVVHLRLSDHRLLKFAPGPRDVPVNLLEAEKEILRRNGAKPIEASSKTAASGPKTTSGESGEAPDTSDQDEAKSDAPEQSKGKKK